jgi:large subunit ribosomal protein L21
MYAVIETGGKQYRVSPGDLLVVEKLDGAPGDVVAFDKVLLIGEGSEATVGAPTVDGAKVSATLIETRKGEKVKIFKKIRRQGYRRTRGHRQWESVLRVTALAGAGVEAAWDGEVDLTPRSTLVARAQGLARSQEVAAEKAAERAARIAARAEARAAKSAPKAAAKPAKKAAAKVEAAPEAEAAPAKKAPAKRAPKKAADGADA